MIKVTLTDTHVSAIELAISQVVTFWETQLANVKNDINPPAGMLRLTMEQVESWKRTQKEIDAAIEEGEEIE